MFSLLRRQIPATPSGSCSAAETESSSGSQSSGSDSDSSASSSASVDEASEGSAPGSEILLAKRRAQTAKARAARSRNRYQRLKDELAAATAEQDQEGRTERFQRQLFTKDLYDADKGMKPEQRMRAVYSYFKALASAVVSMFLRPMKHVIAVVVVDDTNIKMAEQGGSTAVYAVMNGVQSVHARTMDDGLVHFRIHQPMICLQDATAVSLHRSATSWCFCCASGVGSCLARLGLHRPANLSNFSCGVWVLDSLKANSKLFRRERMALSQARENRNGPREDLASTEVQLAFHVTCNIHKLALVRKPMVLIPNNFWSTLVRLAHLFESRSFKQRFRESLTFTVLESFRRVEVQEPPPDFSQWAQATSKILESAETLRPKYQIRAERLYKKMCNSDPRQPDIVHFCVLGQCHECSSCSEDEIVAKVVEALFGLFGRGFRVPLLSRWKHYGAASSYVFRGNSLHRILPRVLANMSRRGTKSKRVAALLARADRGQEGDLDQGGFNDEGVEDESFAERNGRRLQLVQDALADPAFDDNSRMVNMFCGPIDVAMNRLLKRTRDLRTLRMGIFPDETDRSTSLSQKV